MKPVEAWWCEISKEARNDPSACRTCFQGGPPHTRAIIVPLVMWDEAMAVVRAIIEQRRRWSDPESAAWHRACEHTALMAERLSPETLAAAKGGKI